MKPNECVCVCVLYPSYCHSLPIYELTMLSFSSYKDISMAIKDFSIHRNIAHERKIRTLIKWVLSKFDITNKKQYWNLMGRLLDISNLPRKCSNRLIQADNTGYWYSCRAKKTAKVNTGKRTLYEKHLKNDSWTS